jgi:hypothetical protein
MEQFDQLIAGLCTLTGISASRHLLAGNAINVDGISFAMAVHAQSDPDALLLYADFGSLDLEKKAMLYHAMLKENFMMQSSRNGTFGVCENTDSVVLIECMSLAATTPDLLLARMRLLVHKANYFNQQHRGGQKAVQQAVHQSSAMQSLAHRSRLQARCAS